MSTAQLLVGGVDSTVVGGEMSTAQLWEGRCRQRSCGRGGVDNAVGGGEVLTTQLWEERG